MKKKTTLYKHDVKDKDNAEDSDKDIDEDSEKGNDEDIGRWQAPGWDCNVRHP